MEGDGGHIEQSDECRRKYMLARVLLHMVTPTRWVDQAANAGSPLGRFICFEVVDNSSIFRLNYFGHAQLGRVTRTFQRNPPRVIYLTAAGGVKRRAIEEHSMAAVDFGRRHDFRNLALELIQKRIVIIQPLSHNQNLHAS